MVLSADVFSLSVAATCVPVMFHNSKIRQCVMSERQRCLVAEPCVCVCLRPAESHEAGAASATAV